jgi:RNA polymerase sigma factor (sigma-70 family)
MHATIETLVELAKRGDKGALEILIRKIQDRVYGLAIRMLYYPADAEDATQEIIVKVITQLSSFRQECAFDTWVYRVASNHLLNTNKRRAERMEITFKQYEEQIDKGLTQSTVKAPLEAEQNLITEEIMIRCMQGMLLCFDRELRIAFILGGIFEVSGDEAADILQIKPSAFRKRYSRARTRMRNFMTQKCGLFNTINPCRCSLQLDQAVKTGWINSENLLFSTHPSNPLKNISRVERIQEMNEIERVAALFRCHPNYAAPETFVREIKKLIDSGKFRVFDH